jgi:uncharacterized protein YukE
VDIEWAERMSDISRNLQGILREHDDDGIGDSARLYERIDRVFNLFSCGEDFGAEKMNDCLAEAKESMIEDREQDFQSARDDLGEWQGTAADQFRTYLYQLNDGMNLMVDRIETLQMILRAHAVLVRGMRKDVLDLVKKTLDGIAAAETDAWRVGVTVAGAVAGFVAAAATMSGPAWAVMALVAAEMASGASGVAVEVSGAEDELGVIVNFVDSAEGMLHLIDIERLRLEKGFRVLAANVTDGKLVQVRPDRPTVITAPDFQPETFGMKPDTQAGHPVPTDTSDLVPEPKKHADGPFDGEEHDHYPEQGPA